MNSSSKATYECGPFSICHGVTRICVCKCVCVCVCACMYVRMRPILNAKRQIRKQGA